MDADTVLAFGLSIETAEHLVRGGILRYERLAGNSKYVFEHDLIEQYFVAGSAFSSYAIKHLKEAVPSVLALLKRDYPTQYAMYCFYTGNTDPECAHQLLQDMQYMLIPSNIRKEFFLSLVGWLILLHEQGVLADLIFLEYVTKCCIHIRDFISEATASVAFDKCYHSAMQIDIVSAEILKQHFAFIIHYCENRNHLNRAEIFQENIHVSAQCVCL